MTAGVCMAPANGGGAVGAWWRPIVWALFCSACLAAAGPGASAQDTQSASDPSATSQTESGTAGDGSSTDEASGGATTDAIAAAATPVNTGAESSEAKAQEHAEEFSGSFTESIPIEVPPFHGIEPKLALSYDSGRRNGIAGVGWRLQGLSQIERTSPRLGAPRFDAADIYMLDGEELIACTTAMVSPSCDTGGNYVTRVESYLRIKKTASPNIWEVWSRDGTKLTYKPINTWGTEPGTGARGNYYRWLLASVADTHGNTVTYSYTGCTTSECYPSSISYTGAVIQFMYEPRPDLITYATGSGLGQSPWYLETIAVQAAGQRARAYKLTYATSGSTARSRLASVQQFGKDATLDADGTVTGGTALLATTLSYSNATSGFAPTAWARNQRTSYIALLGDFDGDGRTDVLRPRTNGTCYFDVDESTGSAFSLHAWPVNGGAGSCPNGTGTTPWFAEDFNGDGKTDVSVGGSVVYLSTGTGFTGSTWQTYNPGGTLSETQWVSGDFTGDGKADLATYEIRTIPNPDPDGDDTTQCFGRRFISTGTVFTVSALTVPVCEKEVGGHRKKGPFWAGDFNGDGKTDLLFTSYHWKYPPRGEDPYVDGSDYQVALSTGSSFAGLATWLNFGQTGFPPSGDIGDGNWLTADVNGDGSTDFVRVSPTITTYISTGDGLVVRGSSIALTTACGSTSCIWGTGDFDGDGAAELATIPAGTVAGTTVAVKVLNWNGSGFLTQSWGSTVGGANCGGNVDHQFSPAPRAKAICPADFNGDGKADLAAAWPSGTSTTLVQPVLSQGAVPDLLAIVKNSLGGTTTVLYTPSSAWVNGYLPFIMQTATSVILNDGRGNQSTTSYAYAGGSWQAGVRRFISFRTVTATLPCNAGETRLSQQAHHLHADPSSGLSPAGADRGVRQRRHSAAQGR